jgi:hypothetical protein
MAQKKYQKLQEKNLRAAAHIYEYLKERKVVSEKTFGDLYCEAKPSTRGGSFDTLIRTTRQFLYDHSLMTTQNINGLIIHTATQKCFRSKSFKNATIEVQEVKQSDIQKAIQYQELNNGMVPAEIEGKVIANILGLEGRHVDSFVHVYAYLDGQYPNLYSLGREYQILNALSELTHSRRVKKIEDVTY